MRIVIVGDGKVGFSLAKNLSQEEHDIVVIDSNPEALQEALEALDIMVINGNGAVLQIQKEADVEHSDLFIAVTSYDEINILCCVLAKKLGCPHTVSRVRNTDYREQLLLLRSELGLSMTVNPEFSAAREIFRLIQFPSFIKLDSFARSRVELVEIAIKENSKLIDKRLDQLYDLLKMKLLVCVIERNNEVIIPTGNTVLKCGDKITVTAPVTNLAKLVKKLDISKQKIKNAIIVGGSTIAEHLAQQLINSGVSVKIIEQDEERCRELALKISDAVIIHGDGTKQDLLLEEGIADTDAIISLTNIDEENLIVSMYADHLNVPKVITKIDRSEYSHIFADKGIGSVVCPKLLATAEIIRFVRAMNNSEGEDSILTLHRLVDDKVEALEFIAKNNTRNLGVPLSDIKFKQNLLVATISRGNKIIIPQGSDVIKAGDKVVIVTATDSRITELNDIFQD